MTSCPFDQIIPDTKWIAFGLLELLMLVSFSFIYLMIEIFILNITDDKAIILVIPIIITMTSGVFLAINKGTLEKWNNLSLLVNPVQCTVTDQYEEEYQVLVRVKNNLVNGISCSVEIIIPHDIIVQINDTEFRDTFREDLALNSGDLHYFYLFLKSEKVSDSIENLKVRVLHKMGVIEESVVLFVRS